MDSEHTLRLRRDGARPAECVVLAGGPSVSPFVSATGHSPWDVSITESETLLGWWISRLRGHAPELRFRLLQGTASCDRPHPRPAHPGRLGVSIERERVPARGVAGALRDACLYRGRPDDLVLVIDGPVWLSCDVGGFLDAAGGSGGQQADMVVSTDGDGAPAGLSLFRRELLERVPKHGYFDAKEQWIPELLRAGAHVSVHQISDEPALRVRSTLDALMVVGAVSDNTSLVCDPDSVADGANVYQSVIMPGARVEAGATVVRSLVFPDARVQSGSVLVDGAISGKRVLRGVLRRASFWDGHRAGPGMIRPVGEGAAVVETPVRRAA